MNYPFVTVKWIFIVCCCKKKFPINCNGYEDYEQHILVCDKYIRKQKRVLRREKRREKRKK